jgi:hypothetical protein
VEPELLAECADWIAEMLAEEGMWVDAGLIEEVLRREAAAPVRIPAVTHREAAAHIARQLAEDGVQTAPAALDERLVLSILEWQDEFLALAGRPRHS